MERRNDPHTITLHKETKGVVFSVGGLNGFTADRHHGIGRIVVLLRSEYCPHEVQHHRRNENDAAQMFEALGLIKMVKWSHRSPDIIVLYPSTDDAD